MTSLKSAIAALALLTIAATSSTAAPYVYAFDYRKSDIGFVYTFNGNATKGKFPAFNGNLVVDFQNIQNSKVSVNIDASKGQGGFIFATQALRGKSVLNTQQFPTISFNSTNAVVKNGRATVDGKITVRGVTKPIKLNVRFFKLQGQDPADRDTLQMTITTRVNRHDFGASGYPDMVGEFLDIKINAKIDKQGPAN